jgi:chemotaxis protein CheC
MMNSNLSLDELAEFEQDAMCEIGNIIINACLATMADMLSMRLDCSLPSYSIISSNEIVTEITHNTVQEYTLLLNVIFTSVKRQTEGRLVLLLTSASIANLIQRIDQFLAGI